MLTSLIAVAGTLLGILATSHVQGRAARNDRAADRHAEQLASVTSLVAALADHRRAMWLRETARLEGADEPTLTARRADSHNTRSTITVPHTTVAVLLPALRAAADRAVDATYALRGADSLAVLSGRRAAAKDATAILIAAAADHFGG